MFLKTLRIVVAVAGIVPAFLLAQATPPALAPQQYAREGWVFEKLYRNLNVEPDGRGTREMIVQARILSDAGVKTFAVLTFPYTSDNEAVDVDYVRVRKPDGTVVKTPYYNIQDLPAEVTRTAPLYSDIHEKHIAVKALAAGDVLEYRILVHVIKPVVVGQFWFEHSFRDDAIIQDERVEVSLPSSMNVKVVSPEYKPDVVSNADRRIYRWTHANLKVKEVDLKAIPPRYQPPASIQLTTFASWEDVARWYDTLLKDRVEVTPALQAKAAELTKGLKTDEEKVRAIYNFVSLKIHYIGLDFGIGRYQPHAADDVLDNAYGDCKDKHTLLAVLLKSAGYESWPVLINAQRKLDPAVPSPAQFNHVITLVHLAGENVFLDSTPEVAPFRLLTLPLRGSQALKVSSASGPALVTTPENPPFAMEQEFSAQGKLSSDGTFTGHMEQSYRGDAEVLMRTVFRQVPESKWAEMVQRFSYSLNFGGDVSNVKATPPEQLDEPFRLSYDYVRKNYGNWEHQQTSAPLPPMGIEPAAVSQAEKLAEPFPLGQIGKVTYRSKVELPDGFSLTPGAAVTLTQPSAVYRSTSVLEKNVWTITRELEVKKSTVDPADWADYKKFAEKVSDDEFASITVSSGVTGANGGPSTGVESAVHMYRQGVEAMSLSDLPRAKEWFQKAIAADPKLTDANLKLGYVLRAQNDLKGALAAFRKEEEVAPSYSAPYFAASALLVQTGRKDEAADEVRKLIKADPNNERAVLELARLLSNQGKHAESVSVLGGAVKTNPKATNLQIALGNEYLRAGESDKAVNSFRAGADANPGDDLLLNNIAYILADHKLEPDLAKKYAEASLRDLEMRSINDVAAPDTGERVTYELALVWDTVGWIYFQNGDTARSLSFVRSAWLLGQHPVVGEHLAEIYEKLGNRKDAEETYKLALAAAPPVVPASAASSSPSAAEQPGAELSITDKINARYQKLTGHKPEMHETVRLPDGTWTKLPYQQLTEMRIVELGKIPGMSGWVAFAVVFSPGHIETVTYASGEYTLEPLADKLKAAHFQVEFPTGSQAKVFRSVEVTCTAEHGCVAMMTKPGLTAQRASAPPAPLRQPQ